MATSDEIILDIKYHYNLDNHTCHLPPHAAFREESEAVGVPIQTVTPIELAYTANRNERCRSFCHRSKTVCAFVEAHPGK